MKERPIIFRDESVRAIIAGRKTMSRRVIRDEWWRCLDPDDEDDRATAVLRCPFGVPGDQLWVREAWGDADVYYQGHVNDCPSVVAYRADYAAVQFNARCPMPVPQRDLVSWNWAALKWRSPIHMPRWASRLLLTVTEVRVERLKQITAADAIAEGATRREQDGRGGWSLDWSRVGKLSRFAGGIHPRGQEQPLQSSDVWLGSPQMAFAHAWDALNGKRAPWASDPWVWVVAFTRAK
jgi:hypothetical protein